MSSIFTKKVMAHFEELLKNRLLGEVRLSEDSVRYSLYSALRTEHGIADSEIQLGYDHPGIPRAKVDSFLPASDRHGAAVWELKYDRAIPSGKNQPRSNKAGAFTNDLFRLAAFNKPEGTERILIYLTDREMAVYLSNPRNGFSDLFNLAEGQHFKVDRAFLSARAPSVRSKVKAPVVICYAVGLRNSSLPREHELRMFEVGLPSE